MAVRFSELTATEKATEAIRWIGVVPAANVFSQASGLLPLTSVFFWPLAHLSPGIFVVAGSVVAPRFRVATSLILCGTVVFKQLAWKLFAHPAVSISTLQYVGLHVFVAACGAALVYASVKLRSGAVRRESANDPKQLFLAIVAVSLLTVAYGMDQWKESQNRKFWSERQQNTAWHENTAHDGVRGLATQLELYHNQAGEYPTTEQGIRELLRADDGSYGTYRDDPWDTAYQYERLTPHAFRIWSNGPDGLAGSADDTTLTKAFGEQAKIDSLYQRSARERLELYQQRTAAN